MTGSGSNATVTFISNRTYIDEPLIEGTNFTFGPKLDSQGNGTQIELKDAVFTNGGTRIQGTIDYFTTMGQFRTGLFTLNRVN